MEMGFDDHSHGVTKIPLGWVVLADPALWASGPSILVILQKLLLGPGFRGDQQLAPILPLIFKQLQLAE